ncbi:sugar O-acyltransferase (sialic acid O-acetyltransferase NeuD family) [Lewinella marina]|uniref:Lipoyl-binding domain-containing protein n=1 Tax=Neolewinella marina TaxID=438751 RepID=A0A2G0CBW3_9BACT|nr:NeuD/PglB/VioB family sugar acetyltransferase [Neolewinella marina]NJB86671.1 sugar O-acyltransferase (sialic acid O-acetyltransferase NeuD family) [Neolewinella marina]PHK97479.1 hypothetical protein CGL56_15380 [Neolewinella marina]
MLLKNSFMAGNQSIDIIIPKETVSDDFYRVTELNFVNGDQVKEGDTIGALETSKADFELEAPADGFIYYLVEEGDDVAAGKTFAQITTERQSSTSDQTSDPDLTPATGSLTGHSDVEVRVSRAARDLMQTHGLTNANFPGTSLITTNEVRRQLGLKSGGKKPSKNAPAVRIGGLQYDAQSVLIVGDQGHAGACLDLLELQPGLKCAGFIGTDQSPSEVFGLPVLGTNDDLPDLLHNKGITKAVIGIGALANPGVRTRLYNMLLEMGFQFPNLVHPRAVIERSVKMGTGNQVFAGALVGSNVAIGSNCIINSGAIISHDCVLSDNVHLTPASTLAGMVSVGANTVVGMNSNVFLGVSIGSNQLITNGENVFKNIADK